MWQSIVDDLKDHAFTLIAVAIDQPEAARPWIEAARPTYPCLIDRDHHLTDLYHLVNVPQAVWIDEEGRIVRPPEIAGSTDSLRHLDRKTFALPPDVAAERQRAKAQYFDAVRHWGRHGAASPNALDPARVAARLEQPSSAVAEAHARYRLGLYLQRNGGAGAAVEAAALLAEATRLHPDSWTMYRQIASKGETGLASSADFWARVDALGERPYYRAADIVPTR